MGYNYYAVPIPSNEVKERIVRAIYDNEFLLAQEMIPEKIHIGKSSMGWMFCFNHNNWKYFERSRESISAFLINCEIFDEYNRKITYTEFWDMVEKKKNGLAHLTWNGEPVGTMESGLNFSNSTEFS